MNKKIKELKEEIRKLRQAVEKIALYLNNLDNNDNGYYKERDEKVTSETEYNEDEPYL